jgi:hypothetical protein
VVGRQKQVPAELLLWQAALKDTRSRVDPARDRMPCLLLFGPTGIGKTRIVQNFLGEHRSSFDDVTGRTRLPVVAVQMPPAPSERDFTLNFGCRAVLKS